MKKKEKWAVVIEKDNVLGDYDVFLTEKGKSRGLLNIPQKVYFHRVFQTKREALRYASQLKKTLLTVVPKNEKNKLLTIELKI